MPTYDLTSSKTGRTYQVDFASDPTPEDVDYAINFFDAEEPAAPAEQPGFIGQMGESLMGGGQLALGGGRTSLGVLTGDVPGMAAGLTQMQQAQARLQASQTPEDVAFAQDIAQQAQEMEQAEGFFPTLREAVDLPLAVARRPVAALRTAVQSLPNIAVTTPVTLAGAALGGVAGAAAGLPTTGPGAVLTGLAGAATTGAAANAAIEVGYALNDLLNERTGGASATMTEEQIAAYLEANPDIVDEAQRIGLTRGATIGAVEALGLKGAGRLTAAPARAAEQAARTALAREGVDLASQAAVRQAMATPALRQAAETAAKAATDQFNLTGRALGAVGIEAGTAGGAELLAQKAAGQELDYGEAFLETLGEGLAAPASVLGARRVEMPRGSVLNLPAEQAVQTAAAAMGDEFPSVEELTTIAGPEAASQVATAVADAGAIVPPVTPVVQQAQVPAQPASPAVQPVAVDVANQPSPNLAPRATENAPARPVRQPGQNYREFKDQQDEWDNTYGRTHNEDGTPYQPTVLDEVLASSSQALASASLEERIDAVGTDIGAELGTGLTQLLNDGWVWDAQQRRMVDPQNRGESPRQALTRIRGGAAPAAQPAPVAPVAPATQPAAPRTRRIPVGDGTFIEVPVRETPAPTESLPAVEAQAEAAGQQPAIQTPDETEIPEASGLPPVQSQPPVPEAAVNLEEGAALGGGQGEEGQVTAEQLSAIPVGQTYTDPTGGVWTRRENQFGEPVLVTQSEGGQLRLSPQDVVAMVRRAAAPTQPPVSPATGTVPTESLPADTQPTSGDVGTVDALRAVATNTATPEQLDTLTQQGLARVVQGQPVITDAGVAMLPAEERPRLTEAERVTEIEGQTQPQDEIAEEVTSAIEETLTNEEKQQAAEELDEPSWGPAALAKFKQALADWSLRAATFSTKLVSLFKKVLGKGRQAVLAATIFVGSVNVTSEGKVETITPQVIEIPRVELQSSRAAAPVPEMPTLSGLSPQQVTTESSLPAVEGAAVKAPVAVPAGVEEAPMQMPSATFGGETASQDTSDVANWIVRTGDTKGKPFLIADKRNGVIFLFDKDGKLIKKAPALFGKNVGDARPPKFDPEEKARRTPAGRFAATLDTSPFEDFYGSVIDFYETGDAVLAIHRLYTLDPSENRSARLASATPADNRISYGCINLGDDVYFDTVAPAFEGGGVVYILPETQQGRRTLAPLKGTKMTSAEESIRFSTNTPATEIPAPTRPLTGDAQRNETMARRRRGKPQLPTGLRTVDGAVLPGITPTLAQATQARTLEAQQTPGAQDTWIGTSEEYLAENPDATFVRERRDLEAFYDGSIDRAVILTDRVQVREGDAVRAARNGTSAALEAVRRLIRHESFVHRGWRALPENLKREFLSIAENVVPADDLDQLAKIYKRFANWRNDPSLRALAVEEWLAQRLERIEKLPAGSDSVLNQLVDWAKRVWQWLAGDDSVEPTRAELVDLMRQMVRALETGEKEAADDGQIRPSFIGENAEISQFMRDSLDAARTMAAEGKTSEEIRAVTGWFPGRYDGKMRWELPDNEVSFTPESSSKNPYLTIGEALDYPALFEAYPSAKNIYFRKSAKPDYVGGSFDPISNVIEVNSNRPESEQLSSVLHEIQHWIQGREKFAEGSSPDNFYYDSSFRPSDEVQKRLDAINEERVALRSEEVALEEFFRNLPDSQKGVGRNVTESRRLEAISSRRRELSDEESKIVKPERNKFALSKYQRTAGEIEARDVQARMALTPEQRRAVAPYSSENIALEDAVVILGGRESDIRFSLTGNEADTDAEYERVMARYKGQRSTETTAQKRTYSPIVRDLLERRESGEQISEAVLQRAIEEYFPSYQVPVPKSMADLPSQQTVLDAITQDKKTAHQEAMQKGFPKDGSPITVRQDVPAMTQYGVGVVTTRTDSGTFYLPAARFTEPKFGMNERQNIKIAKGEAKGPYFFIKGKWSQDQTMPGDLENWTQVGFNPDRHSYYYERGTSRQVVGGKEAYQVGNTVFVKDAVFGKEGGALRFSLTGNEAEIEQIIREDRDDAESGVVPTRARPLAPGASPTSATEQINGQEIIERNQLQKTSMMRTEDRAIEIVNKLGPMSTWLSTLLNAAWRQEAGLDLRSPLGRLVVAESLLRVSNASKKDRLRFAELNRLLALEYQTGTTPSATVLATQSYITQSPRYAALFAVQAMLEEQRKLQAGVIDPALGSTEGTVAATLNVDTQAQQQATEDVDSELRLKDALYELGLAGQNPDTQQRIRRVNDNVFRLGVLARLREQMRARAERASFVSLSASAVEAEYAAMSVEQLDAEVARLEKEVQDDLAALETERRKVRTTKPKGTAKTVVEQAKDLIEKLEAAPGVKKTPKPNPVRDLYKAHLKQPMAEGDFVRAMVGQGVPEADAQKLYELAAVKIAAAEATKVAGRTARLMDRETSSLENLINKLRPKITGGLNWREIFDRPLSNQREWRQQLFDTLRADPALANLSPAEVRDLAAELDRIWNAKREAAFKALAKRMNLPGAREGVKEKIAESAPALIRYINSGAFNDVNFRNAIADKFGVPQLDEARVDEVIALVQKAQEAKTQVERNKYMNQAIRLMQEGMKAELGEVISNYWVTSVLSGFATLFDMAMSVLNGARVMTQFSADAIIRQRDFKLAGRAAKNYFQSLGNAILESSYYFVSGDPTMLDNYQFTLNTYLREGSAAANPFDYFERIIKDPNKSSWKKIVPYYFAGLQRLMTAFDHINSTSTAQGTLEHALAYNRKLFGDARMPSEQDVAAARAQAVELAGGDRTYAQRRKITAYTRQILNEEFNKNYPGILDEAKDIGRIAAYQNDPTGIGGLIYHTLLGLTNKAVAAASEFRDEGRALGEAQGIVGKFMREFMYILAVNSRNISGTRFVRFVGNRVNELISFTPGVGFLRLYEKDTSPTRRAMLLQNQTVGMLLGVWVTVTLLRMMGDEEDDEKRGFRVSGSWQGLTPDRKNQLRANNMTPNSVQIWDGEKWVNFNYTPWPVASLLATVGNLADMKKYHPEKWDAKSQADRILAAAWAGAFSFKDLSAISGFMDMLGASAYSTDPVDSAIKWLGKFSSNYVGGVVPRMLKDIDMIMDPKARKPTDVSEHFAKELPFYRRTEAGGEKMYNIFGEQVELSRLPWRRVVTASRPEREYQILAELNNRGLFLGAANPDNRTVGYGASRRELTDEEAERYSVETGKRYRQFILDQGERLLEMPEERAKEFISRRTEALRNAALRDAIRTQP